MVISVVGVDAFNDMSDRNLDRLEGRQSGDQGLTDRRNLGLWPDLEEWTEADPTLATIGPDPRFFLEAWRRERVVVWRHRVLFRRLFFAVDVSYCKPGALPVGHLAIDSLKSLAR
jgi:hypothetical protein